MAASKINIATVNKKKMLTGNFENPMGIPMGFFFSIWS